MGAHTTSDDPTKYRDNDELRFWTEADPITRFEKFLRLRGEGGAFFEEIEEEARDLTSDVRRRIAELGSPPPSQMFQHVYSEPHPLMDAQLEWLENYEASFEGGTA